LEAEFATGTELPDEVRQGLLHLAEDVVADILDHAGIVRF
jgi:type I restriction enzyme R subunit